MFDILDQEEFLKDPEAYFESISKVGEVMIVFTQRMYLQEIFENFRFESQGSSQ